MKLRRLDNLTDRLREWTGTARGIVDTLTEGNPVTQLTDHLPVFLHLRQYFGFQRALLDFRAVLAVLFAHRAGLFEALDDEPTLAATIADRSDLTHGAARTLLSVLTSTGFADRVDGGYAASGFTREFLQPHADQTLTPMLELLDTYTANYEAIARGFQTGERAEALDIRDDGPAVDSFLESVNSYIDHVGHELLARTELPDVEHIIVGSMGVSFSALLLERYPNAEVTYGCLDHLVERIPRLRHRYGVDPRRVTGTHAHSGEPADDIWGREAFDVVFLTKKMLLDPEAQIGEKFARKAYDVLDSGGVAIFWEAVHSDDGSTPSPLALESVFDIGVNPSASPVTEGEFASQLRSIGYDSVEFIRCFNGATSFTVARKS